MLSENDRQNLLRNLNRNKVVLVTGAGFSADATNIHDKNLPCAGGLAEALWGYLYDDPYDQRSKLKSLYQVATKDRRGVAELRKFLYGQLHATAVPTWYKQIPNWFWHRIYTFNADDVLEQAYSASNKAGLQRIVAPDYFAERDQFLRKIQYIKLHGSIDSPKDFTFGPREYASRAALRADIWYQHFIEDYSTKTTLFVGTALDEPLFWQYIEMRGQQLVRGEKVRRPKCFLVTRSISKPDMEMLEQYNIVAITSSCSEFFEWLSAQQDVMTRESVLRLTNEELGPAIEAAEAGKPTKEVERAEYFFTIFRLPSRPANPRQSSMFLLGVPPTWDDIASDIDARRDISQEISTVLHASLERKICDIVQITSAAGGGKSTLARRAALELVDDGYTVYFSDGSSRPMPDLIVDHILTQTGRTFMFFDNAGDDISLIAEIWDKVKYFASVPVFVVISRTNDAAFRAHDFQRVGAKIVEIPIPDLSRLDIERVIDVLNTHNLLGVLKDKKHSDQIAAFEKKAQKQILVAMREATSGLGFDEILLDEYNRVQPEQAKLLYLLNALSSDDDYGLSMEQMISAMDLAPNETQLLVEKNLQGILVQHENDPSRYYIRHPAIANFIVASAPRKDLAAATAGLLISLASNLPVGPTKKFSRAFKLYRRLLSHTEMQSRFVEEADLVRSIYDEVQPYFRDDGHYWLHYGAYEVEHGGEIDLAENYLDQAANLLPNSKKVETARAHLLFKKAKFAKNASVAEGFMTNAVSLLRTHMASPTTVSLHALLIFGNQMDDYIRQWVIDEEQSSLFREVSNELRQAVPQHMEAHKAIVRVLQSLKRSELETAVKRY